MMKNFLNRLIVTIGIVLIIIIFTVKFKDKSLAFLGNLWTTGGLSVSTVISQFILSTLIDNLKKINELGIEKKVKIVQLISYLFVALTFISILLLVKNSEIKSWLFGLLGLIPAFGIWIMDLKMTELESFQHLKEILVLDQGIFVGILLTIVIGFILDLVVTGLSDGFVGGATAFQLIIANLVFDPKYYEPKKEG
ncbi:MAG: hypothetical protein B5M53_08290 [Candidatus Cloacimonas sp. 4484_209]|nr:MAG: hypothetical protein B5M53_08290 [Candidatus Cloacimonas sp. 4484_209]